MQDKSRGETLPTQGRIDTVKHQWVDWWTGRTICEFCTKEKSLDNLNEVCYSVSVNFEQKDLGEEYYRVRNALIKYGRHMDCKRTYGGDCSCGFWKFQEEFHIPKVGRG